MKDWLLSIVLYHLSRFIGEQNALLVPFCGKLAIIAFATD